MVRFGFLVGAAFQIQDDLLNLTGSHERYGKELNGDLFEGKRTLLIIRLLQRCSPEEAAFVARFLATERAAKKPADVDVVLSLLARYGCVEDVRHYAQALLGAASYDFDQCLGRLPPSRDREFLRGLMPWVIEQP